MHTSQRRLIATVVIALITVPSIFVAYWLYENVFGDLFNDPIVAGVGVLALVGAIVSLVKGLRRHPTQGLSVLWCRRFGHHEAEAGQRNIWISAVLAKAAKRVALPVTLLDRSVSGSQSVSDGLQVPIMILLMFIASVGYVGVALLLPEWFLDSSVGFIAIVALYIATLVGIGTVLDWLVTSFATSRETPEGLRHTLAQARDRKSFWGELLVVRCTDDDWQDCIGAVIDEVDFIILDVTETNPNIGWEIQRSYGNAGDDRVLFLRELPDDSAPVMARAAMPAVDPEFTEGLPREVNYLHYGMGWIDKERQYHLDQLTKDYTVETLGPRSLELAGILRDWMQDRAAVSA